MVLRKEEGAKKALSGLWQSYQSGIEHVYRIILLFSVIVYDQRVYYLLCFWLYYADPYDSLTVLWHPV